MTFYERFEQLVAIILSFAIAVAVVALWELLTRIGGLLIAGTLDPLDHRGENGATHCHARPGAQVYYY